MKEWDRLCVKREWDRSWANGSGTGLGRAGDGTVLGLTGSGTCPGITWSGTGPCLMGSGRGQAWANSGTGLGLMGNGTGCGLRGSGTGLRLTGSGTSPGLRGSGTGPGLRGSGTGLRLTGSGTSPGLRGSGTGPGLRGSGTGPGLREWDRSWANREWDRSWVNRESVRSWANIIGSHWVKLKSAGKWKFVAFILSNPAREAVLGIHRVTLPPHKLALCFISHSCQFTQTLLQSKGRENMCVSSIVGTLWAAALAGNHPFVSATVHNLMMYDDRKAPGIILATVVKYQQNSVVSGCVHFHCTHAWHVLFTNSVLCAVSAVSIVLVCGFQLSPNDMRWLGIAVRRLGW